MQGNRNLACDLNSTATQGRYLLKFVTWMIEHFQSQMGFKTIVQIMSSCNPVPLPLKQLLQTMLQSCGYNNNANCESGKSIEIKKQSSIV